MQRRAAGKAGHPRRAWLFSHPRVRRETDHQARAVPRKRFMWKERQPPGGILCHHGHHGGEWMMEAAVARWKTTRAWPAARAPCSCWTAASLSRMARDGRRPGKPQTRCIPLRNMTHRRGSRASPAPPDNRTGPSTLGQWVHCVSVWSKSGTGALGHPRDRDMAGYLPTSTGLTQCCTGQAVAWRAGKTRGCRRPPVASEAFGHGVRCGRKRRMAAPIEK